MFEGVLQKMITEASQPVRYYLQLNTDFLAMNELIGKRIAIEFIGFQCLNCSGHAPIFRQGFCKRCFFEIPQAADWIMHPELSKAHLGIEDRDLAYEKQIQLQPHAVYLANSSDVKVGVTRKSQIPTRWIDQGAHQALIIAEFPNRYLAGITEVALKKYVSDKTNWRKMVTNTITDTDLKQLKNSLAGHLPQEAQHFYSEDQQEYHIMFPVLKYPQKPISLNLLKTPFYEGKLAGIKGQYLIFEDDTVFNIRSNEGLVVRLKM